MFVCGGCEYFCEYLSTDYEMWGGGGVVKIMAAGEPAEETTEWTKQKKSTFDREAKRGREQRVCVCVRAWGGGVRAVDERMDEGRDVERVPE